MSDFSLTLELQFKASINRNKTWQIYIKIPNYKPVEIKNKCHSPKFYVFYKKMSSPPQILVLYTCSFVTILYIWSLLFNPPSNPQLRA